MIEYKMKELRHSGIYLESINTEPKINVDITIYEHAWTFRFFVETPYGNIWFSNSERLNTIISNLDIPEVSSLVHAVSILSSETRKLNFMEDFARRIENNDDFTQLFDKVAKSIYLSYIHKLYRYAESEYYEKKFYEKNKDGMYIAHHEVLKDLSKYSEANRWKCKIESLNTKEMLERHKLKKLANKLGRKDKNESKY